MYGTKVQFKTLGVVIGILQFQILDSSYDIFIYCIGICYIPIHKIS